MEVVKFRADELVSRNGKSYPVVGARLRVAHEDNETLSITTEMVQYEAMVNAVVKATVITDKGTFTAYGCASASKDERLIDSLLELADTRSIARALRFCGCGVEFTGNEEIPANEPTQLKPAPNIQVIANDRQDVTEVHATKPQLNAIEVISKVKNWDAVECCKRILKDSNITSLSSLSKDEASEIISRMKEAA